MLPYINEDTTSWQLRMISLFDQDPEDLVAMLEDSVKNSSVEIFQSIRKKYYIEKKAVQILNRFKNQWSNTFH